MKKLITILTLLSLSLTCLASDEMEQEFEARFRAFIESGDVSMDALKAVWLYEDVPPRLFSGTQKKFESTISRGLGSLDITEMYPAMVELIKNPSVIEGAEYLGNLEPYKMLDIRYKNKITGGSTGWSWALGESEGKLYMIGHEKQIQAE